VVAADPALLEERARLLNLDLQVELFSPTSPRSAQRARSLRVLSVPLASPVEPGRLNPGNARYVLGLLDRAIDGCVQREFDAMVTAPVQKSVINEGGIPFTGHTEYIAARTRTPRPVMMLVAERLRVALATTHLPLRAVSDALTRPLLREVLQVLDSDLRQRFGIARPRILVCGLNPHAGEGGHLGREEIEIIAPAIQEVRRTGIDASGPVPADTAFTPRSLAGADVVLAMYHDQGLPVLKFAGFGGAVNVTLGLPLIRTSVDHGTALDLAGSGQADAGSLAAALQQAIELAQLAANQHRAAQA
jgi:4-hydroxythreonine-4-phosphate dehydrogenase